MKTQITKGPWEVVEHSWSDTSIVAGDKTICTISIYDEATEETQEQLESEVSANFRLIAAASEMLEMLLKMKEAMMELMDLQDGWENDYIELEALIKKATEQ